MADNSKVITNPQTGQTTAVPIPANAGAVIPPTMDMMNPAWAQQFAVNVANMQEAITQPFYSFVPYPAAGSATPLQFFQSVPTGAITQEVGPGGAGTGGTNMQLVGQLPAGQSFLIQGIGVDYLPGIPASRFGAESAVSQLNDFYTIVKRGVLTLTIGSKNYLTIANLLQLPPRSHINGVAATTDQTTQAAALQTMVSVGFADGPVFNPRPLLIPASQNFSVNIAYPNGAVAIPSADANAMIGVWLYGTLYRPVQ